MYGYLPAYDPRQNKDQMKLTAAPLQLRYPQMTSATMHPSLGYSLDYLMDSFVFSCLKQQTCFVRIKKNRPLFYNQRGASKRQC